MYIYVCTTLGTISMIVLYIAWNFQGIKLERISWFWTISKSKFLWERTVVLWEEHPEIHVLLPKPQKFPYCSIYSTVYVGIYLRPDIWLQWSMNFPRTFATLSFVACRNFPKCSTSLSLHRGGMDWSGDLHMTSVLVMWLSQLCRVLWALQRRLRMHHRLRHMWLRVLCSPTQPSQPAESALCQEQHSGFCKGYECSLWYIQSEAYTQSRNSKSLACLNTSQKPFLSQLHM